MDINYTLPLWTIIVAIVPIIWTMIKMFFKQGNHSILIEQNKVDTANLKRDLESKLDRHKNENDTKLTELTKTSIETNTLVKLLVDNKIKKVE